jgi:hypothetical protein
MNATNADGGSGLDPGDGDERGCSRGIMNPWPHEKGDGSAASEVANEDELRQIWREAHDART